MAGNRPADWHVLDLDKDPTPGDPDRVRNLAKNLHDFADDVSKVLRDIKGMAGEDAILTWAGKTAESFTAEFEDAPGKLKKLKKSYEMAGDALSSYWPELERAQALADKALVKGREAQGDLSSAQTRLTSADSWMDKAGKEADKYKNDDGGTKAGKDVPKPDPDKVKAATRNAASAEKAQTAAQSDVSSAKSNLDAAKKMAEDARKMREDAAGTAKKKLEDASDAGIQNRKWWEEVGDWVTDNWDTIVAVCKVVVAVLGVIAMIIGGPILGAIVLIAALVVLADTLHKYANGEAGLLDVAFAALDCIPGMKGLTSLRGLAKGLKGIKGGLKGLKAMATGVRGLAKSGREMIAGGAKGAYNRLKSVIKGCGDPVDVATGQMFLQQVDVSLPGTLPLVFVRRVASGYRAGRWFGTSWSSTVDQRLEIDEQGVTFVTEDGMLLAYPHPESPEDPVLPEAGPRWPLARLENGAYRIDDPTSGLSRSFAAPNEGLALLQRISDRNRNTIDFFYDADGTPLSIRHSGGYNLELATEEGRITALRLAGRGEGETGVNIKQYGYADGNLSSIVNSSGIPLTFTYDEYLRITSWTDTNNSRYVYAYDELHRCVSQGGEDGHVSGTFEYDVMHSKWPNHRITTFTTSRGSVSSFVINENCQVISEIDPLGGMTQTEYDVHHHIRSWSNALEQKTVFENNAVGDPVSITRPDGAVSQYSYGDVGRPSSLILPDGNMVLCEYDARGNATAITDQTGATTRYSYSEMGHLSTITDALGQTSTTVCDDAGLMIKKIDPIGSTTLYERDAFGRPVAITDPVGATIHLEWTVEGRLARRSSADGYSESWTYDGEGNCTSHVDAMGSTSTYEYTHFDLLAARTEPDGARYEFTHDAELNLVGVTNPLGMTWNYSHDEAGRLSSETDFDGRTISYTHDAVGQLTSHTDALGQTVRYERDALGQVTRRSAHGRVTCFEYDILGRLAQAIGPDATLVQKRDAAGRVLSETVNGRELSYSYDELGRRTRRTTPSGRVSEWRLDGAGHPVVLDISGHTIDFERDRSGREVGRHISGGVSTSQSFDELGRLSSQSVITPDGHRAQHRSYAYRADGYLTSSEDQLNGYRRYDLDAAGRVTAVHAPGWTERYAYDELGNQSSASWPASHPGHEATGVRSYNGTRITRAGNVRYEHDDLGRVVRRQKSRLSRKPDTWRYEWDAEDRLVFVVTPDGTRWRYQYDPLGRRIAKQRLARDTRTVVEQVDFTWDGTTLCEQTTSSMDQQACVTLTWEYDGLRPLAQTESRSMVGAPQQEIDQRFFAIITDLVGSPSELVNEAGEIAWRTRTTLWGTTAWNSSATAYTPLRFPGQYFDPETSLHYNYFRHYDPENGRYVTADPLGLAPAPNSSTYVHNPLLWGDPIGLSPCATAYKYSRDTRSAVGKGNAQAYQIRHCGPTEYRATGGGERVWADGMDANTTELLDAKHVGTPGSSPFIPDSPNIPPFIRDKIRVGLDDEFRRYGAVINDSSNPMTGLRVITNHPDAVPFFQGLMQQHGVPGRVVLAP